MAITGFDVAIWHLIAFVLAIIFRQQRAFAATRLTAADLVAQTNLVRTLIARSLRGGDATKEDIEDLAQDVMLAAWHAMQSERYRPDPSEPPQSALRGWLWRIVYHHVHRYRQQARRHREHITSDPPDVADERPTAEEALEAAEVRLDLIAAVRGLPETIMLVVAAHDFDGIPMKTISERIGIPASTAYKWRARGLKELAVLLTEPDEE